MIRSPSFIFELSVGFLGYDSKQQKPNCMNSKNTQSREKNGNCRYNSERRNHIMSLIRKP